ncbi:MAG: hypothetical protein IJO28_05435 [Oscillospiraceae bacterium]|nr:hypothetical protein [Oscillospiraceae bacterium]
MAEFKVNTVQLDAIADQLQSLQWDMDNIQQRLSKVQLGNVLQMRGSWGLQSRLADCLVAVGNHENNLKKLSNRLDWISELYKDCEKGLTEPKTQAQAQPNTTNIVDDSIWGQIWSHTPKWTDIIGWFGKKCAPLGVVSGIINFSQGNTAGVISGLKALCGATGPVTKAVASGSWSKGLMEFFGFAEQGVGSLSDSWNKWLDGMNLSKQTTVAGKIGTVAKWGGYILTAAGNVVDNIEEYNEDANMTVGRAVGETVVETAVDIGLSIGAGVLLAAALPATAPAILVGATAAAAVWAANEVCEWITGGENIGEAVANAVCDGVEAVGNFVSNAADTIAEGASAAWNGVCNWAGGLFS